MPEAVEHHAACSSASDLGDLVDRAEAAMAGQPSGALAFLPASAPVAWLSAFARDYPILHATTAGHFADGARRDDEVILVTFGPAVAAAGFAPDMRHSPGAVGEQLAAGFGDLEREGRRAGLPASASLLLTDGLASTGEGVVESLRRATRPHQIIVGGASGDGGAFEETRVGLGPQVSATGAAALHLFSKHRVGVGIGHGLSPATDKMTVTRVDGPRLLEIDGRPAFEAYRDFARESGVRLEPESSAPFMLRNELGVFFFDELRAARAPLSADADGSLLLAAPVEEGASICILDGERDPMLEAARDAAEAAKAALQGQEAAAVLVFDCVCRGMIIGDDFGREIGAFEAVFPDVPVAGFLTYGEIARHGGRMQGWHNTTAVVVAIPRD